jgi:hypothetical protein
MIAAIQPPDKVREDRASPNSPASAEYIKHARARRGLRGYEPPVPQSNRPSRQGLLGRVNRQRAST